MKRKIALFLIMSCILTSCGSSGYEPVKNPDWDESKTTDSEESIDGSVVEYQEIEIESEESISEDLNYEVDIILAAYIFDNSTIESYVEQLKTDNPNEKYSVYNEKYYISTITESERLEYITSIEETNALDEAFSQFLNNEQYGGAFVDIKYDDELQNFELYVNKPLYEQNIFACSIGSGLIINAISDTYQAYNFIMPEDRITNIKIIDNATGTEITE